jgi:hypothetical protein
MRARKRALGFTPRRMAVAYLEVYGDLLSGRPSHVKESACVS